jgi:hypothetical protein
MHPSTARSLLTDSEYELVQQASPKYIGKLSERQLKQGLDRARKLRDKNRELGQRQRRATRGKPGRAGKKSSRPVGPEGAENTRRKIELFEQAMERYEASLSRFRGEDDQPRAKRSRAPKQKKRAKAAKTAKASKRGDEVGEVVELLNVEVRSLKPARKPSRSGADSILSRAGGIPIGSIWNPDGAPGMVAARNTSLRARTKKAPSNQRRIKANTRRMVGHTAASTRRRQAKRDAVQRTGRKP